MLYGLEILDGLEAQERFKRDAFDGARDAVHERLEAGLGVRHGA